MPTQRDRENALRLYTSTQLTVEEIGGMFGVSRQTIHAWVDAAGLPRRGPVPHRADREGATADDLDGTMPSDLAAMMIELSRRVNDLQQDLGFLRGQVGILARLVVDRRRVSDTSPDAPPDTRT